MPSVRSNAVKCTYGNECVSVWCNEVRVNTDVTMVLKILVTSEVAMSRTDVAPVYPRL